MAASGVPSAPLMQSRYACSTGKSLKTAWRSKETPRFAIVLASTTAKIAHSSIRPVPIWRCAKSIAARMNLLEMWHAPSPKRTSTSNLARIAKR